MSRILDVYLHDHFAGTLTQSESGDLAFAYDESYRESASHGISISLPLDSEFSGAKVKAFFSNLLPDESVRERLAKSLGVSEKNIFSLLESIGGECAGALAFYPQSQRPSEVAREIEILDDTKLKEILDLLRHRPMLAGDDGYRLSLAGAQDKLAVGFKDGKVQLIKGGAPTTHIIKPIIEHPSMQVQDSAHNEFFCMNLAKRMGIEVPEALLYFADDAPYYLVKRYDRTIGEDGVIERIHQEDFCQALGIAPEQKYEREGGPTIAKCQNVITNHTAMPAADQIKFQNMVIFNYLIGNADAHGKNYSLLYRASKPELAPAYDLLSTAVYPGLDKKMAMKIGNKYNPRDVYRRHFHKMVADTEAAKSNMNKQMESMRGKITDEATALKEELEAQGIVSDIFEKIITVIKERSKHHLA